MTTSKMIENPSRRTALGVLMATTLAGCATQSVSPAEPERLVADAQTTLSNFIRDPDQTWIQDNLSRARALLIAPQVVRAGFIFGGSGGRGVLVARDGRAWAGPAFYNLATASVGFQAGIDVSEVIIVVMTDKGFNSLLSTSVQNRRRREHCGRSGWRRCEVHGHGRPDLVHARERRVRGSQSRWHGREYQRPLE